MITGAKTAHPWKDWEGQIIDGKVPLLRYIGGTRHSHTFVTERPDAEPRTAAVKIFPADDLAIEAQLARWRASAKLSHPNLVRLFETGRGRLGDITFAYVLMEYAEEDLSQVDRPLTVAEADEMLEGTLSVLSYLQSKQLAHGHLKPSNITAVADQLRISSDTIRPTGEWRGDLDFREPYHPPEIEEEGASAAGDIWSCGVVLIEALTKKLPSWEPGAAVPALPDGLPVRFRAPALNCLRRDPGQRWTAAQFTVFLHSDVEKNVEKAPAAQPPARKESSSRKTLKRSYLVAAGVVALMLAALAVWPGLTSRSGEQDLRDVRESAPEALAPKAPDPKTPDHTASPDIIVTQALPDIPAKARNTIQGKVTVKIRVDVDAKGAVTEAHNESPAASRYFGNLALQAARQWKFSPADPASPSQSRGWILHFQFVRDPRRPVSVQATRVR